MSTPYLILALPRSRTTWLSRYLSYGEWVCGHDEAVRMRSLDDVRAWLSMGRTGSVETSIAPFWRTVVKLAPKIRIMTVRRPAADVVESAIRAGVPDVARKDLALAIARQDRKLDQIERRLPGVLRTEYASLASESVCAGIFETCLGVPHDAAWWRKLSGENIQTNIPWLSRYMRSNLPQIDKLIAITKHVMIRDLTVRPPGDRNDVVIAAEPFDTFYRDGVEMFKRHCAMVGENPCEFRLKNLALARQVERMGRLQVMTARCNGRIFGYLMTVIGPSLETEGRISATNTLFFAGEEFPGLGMKLQRAAMSRLKERGVDEVFFHDGVRGTGGRNSVIYRRLGATELGSVYRLNMGDK